MLELVEGGYIIGSSELVFGVEALTSLSRVDNIPDIAPFTCRLCCDDFLYITSTIHMANNTEPDLSRLLLRIPTPFVSGIESLELMIG
jgi:hypothetical protein